jgi:hypothetical protein
MTTVTLALRCLSCQLSRADTSPEVEGRLAPRGVGNPHDTCGHCCRFRSGRDQNSCHNMDRGFGTPHLVWESGGDHGAIKGSEILIGSRSLTP